LFSLRFSFRHPICGGLHLLLFTFPQPNYTPCHPFGDPHSCLCSFLVCLCPVRSLETFVLSVPSPVQFSVFSFFSIHTTSPLCGPTRYALLYLTCVYACAFSPRFLFLLPSCVIVQCFTGDIPSPVVPPLFFIFLSSFSLAGSPPLFIGVALPPSHRTNFWVPPFRLCAGVPRTLCSPPWPLLPFYHFFPRTMPAFVPQLSFSRLSYLSARDLFFSPEPPLSLSTPFIHRVISQGYVPFFWSPFSRPCPCSGSLFQVFSVLLPRRAPPPPSYPLYVLFSIHPSSWLFPDCTWACGRSFLQIFFVVARTRSFISFFPPKSCVPFFSPRLFSVLASV